MVGDMYCLNSMCGNTVIILSIHFLGQAFDRVWQYPAKLDASWDNGQRLADRFAKSCLKCLEFTDTLGGCKTQ